METGEMSQWFVMRDLKRPNAKEPAYVELAASGFEVFTPLTTKIVERGGRRTKVRVPFMHDLLFVHSDRSTLDPYVTKIGTLQYRFMKGAPYRTPMTVRESEMTVFIEAVRRVKDAIYLRPSEITSGMTGARVRMVCEGPLNGYVGNILRVKGSGKKRLLVEMSGILSAGVEIGEKDYVELIEK